MIPTGTASAEPADESEGLARIIGSDLLGGELATEGTATSGNPSDPGANQAPIDATVLEELLSVELPGLAIPLIGDGGNGGLLDLGEAADAGLLDSYSASPTTSSSTATSGAVGDDGAIDAGVTSDPGTIGDARLDLTSLLGQLGVDGLTDEVVDQLSVDLGALASRASQDGTGAADRTYRMAGARLVVSSPAVEQLAATLQSTIGEAESTLNGTLGTGGELNRQLAAVQLNLPLVVARVTAGPATAAIDVDLDSVTQELLATPLVSDNGFVTVDLSAGTITVDLAKVVKNSPTATDLNGLDPNTELLSPAIIQRISDGVGSAVGDLGERAGTAVTRALDGTRLTVRLPGNVDPVIGADNPLDVTIAGTLAEFAGTASTTPNVNIDLGGLGGTLLQTVLDALRPALNGVITNVVRPVVRPLLNTVTTGIEPAVEGLTSTALGALDPLFEQVLPNVATVTINEQTEDDPAELTNETGSSTVRALAIDVLPNLGPAPVAEVNLAASTVRVGNAEEAPVLSASPEAVRAGDTITTTSSGWPPNAEVELTYTDSDGDVAGTSTVTANGDGDLTDSFEVPEGTPTGTLTVTGTDAGGRTASDTVEVLSTPTLDASPATVPQEGTVTTEGEGWPANSIVMLTYRDADGDVLTTRAVPTNADGELTDTYELPPGVAPGTLTIIGAGEGGATAVDSVQVEAAPVIIAGPAEVSAGDTVSVSSSGWPASTDVEVTYTAADGDDIGTSTVTTDEDGRFTDSFEVPAGTPLGDLVVTGSADGGRTATDTVQVVADPVVTSTPGVVRPGDTVTSELTGFPAETEVEVTYTDADGDDIGTSTVATDENGEATDTFEVPAGTPAGALTIGADDGDGNAAEDTVTVVAPAADPSVSSSPGVVRPGDTVTSELAGFPAETEVTVTYTDADGDEIGTSTVTTDENGDATDTFEVPVGTPAGALTIDADDGDGNAAEDVVTVTAPLVDPEVSSSPGVVRPGDTVTSELAGFPAETEVTVTYTDADGDEIGTSTVTTDENGEATDTFEVPDGTPAGPLTIGADDGDGTTAEDTVTVVEPAADPSITAGPAEVEPGETVDVVGDGFPPETEVEITYTDAEGEEIDTHTVTTDEDGSFTDSLEVPAGTPAGELTIDADDGDGTTATDTVTVVDPPAADASVTAGPAEVEPGETVDVVGDGFPPSSEVTVTYTDADGEVVDTHTVTTDEDGSFTDSLVVPAGTPPGSLVVTADDGDATSAQDTVTVVEPAADPTITAGPAEVEPGETVDVVGDGFPPETEVEITYTDAEGDEIDTHTVTTDEDGSFTDSLVVPDGTPAGDLTVTADDGDGTTAEDTVTVVAPPAADPSVTAGPDPVRPGQTVNVVGGGFPPETEVEVTYTDAEGEVIDTHTVTTDEDGSFTDSLVVPDGTPPGDLTVEADADGTTADDTVTVEPAPFTPSLDAQQTEVTYGDEIDVVSSGWPRNSAVTVTYTDSDDEVVATRTVLTDSDGTFTDTLTVPAGTALGELTVSATGGNSLSASDTVDVVADPVIESGPGVVQPGDTVTSDLTGFPPGVAVEITYTDADGEVVETRTVETDEDGSVTDTLVVPDGTPPGELTIVADAGGGVTAQDTVTVAEADPEDPTVSVGPDPVEPGETVTVIGGGFPPSTEVTVTYTDADGEVVAEQTVTSDADGGVEDTLVVPPGTPAGDLTVEIDDGDGTSATGSTTVEVPDYDPAVDSSPGVVEPGDTITSDISGFPPNAEVTITYTDSEDEVIGTTSATADADGAISGETFEVPAGTPMGALTITADDGAGSSASDTVNVADDEAEEPEIVAGPPTVEPGDTVTIEGNGFPPNSDVDVTVTDSDGDAVVETTVQTDENGDFTDEFVVPDGTAPGRLDIEAEAEDGTGSEVAIRVVADGSGVAGEGADADGDGTGGAGDMTGLPDTGSPVTLTLAILGALLILTGAIALGQGRERANREE